jgi:hypothetical protein
MHSSGSGQSPVAGSTTKHDNESSDSIKGRKFLVARITMYTEAINSRYAVYLLTALRSTVYTIQPK